MYNLNSSIQLILIGLLKYAVRLAILREEFTKAMPGHLLISGD